MLGNIMDNMKGKQAEMRERLAKEILETVVHDGAVAVKANANGVLTDIQINTEKVDVADVEALQDLVLVAVNEVLKLAQERQASEAETMLENMLPFGLSGLFGNKS